MKPHPEPQLTIGCRWLSLKISGPRVAPVLPQASFRPGIPRAHGRPDADRFHVHGFIEHGTTTTPFDMTVLNMISRFHLVMNALNNSRTALPDADDLKTW
jgi:hypothetical protein